MSYADFLSKSFFFQFFYLSFDGLPKDMYFQTLISVSFLCLILLQSYTFMLLLYVLDLQKGDGRFRDYSEFKGILWS